MAEMSLKPKFLKITHVPMCIGIMFDFIFTFFKLVPIYATSRFKKHLLGHSFPSLNREDDILWPKFWKQITSCTNLFWVAANWTQILRTSLYLVFLQRLRIFFFAKVFGWQLFYLFIFKSTLSNFFCKEMNNRWND